MQTRCRPRMASTNPGAPRRRRCFGWCRITCTGSKRCMTNVSRASTARSVPWSRGWRASSCRAASSNTGSRVFAATTVRTNTCWRSPASAGTSARAVTPNGSCSGPSGSTPRCSRPCRTGRWCSRSRSGCAPIVCIVGACLARSPASPPAVTAAIRTLTGERDLAVGIVACVQTHGSCANWHPHLHLLVTDGGFRPDGTFVSWPVHDAARLTEAFRRAVLRLFVRLELFDEDEAASMLTWPHSGFHVSTAV